MTERRRDDGDMKIPHAEILPKARRCVLARSGKKFWPRQADFRGFGAFGYTGKR